jgi:hypothetical protein
MSRVRTIRRAAFGKIGVARDDSSVPPVDFQDRCHFVEAGALGLGIDVKVYASNPRSVRRFLSDRAAQAGKLCSGASHADEHKAKMLDCPAGRGRQVRHWDHGGDAN